MTEITRVHLENEMDLILSHKQTMKLGELCGFSLPAQTTLATAVSELARAILECKLEGDLILLVADKTPQEKSLVVQVKTLDESGFDDQSDGFRYARRLIPSVRLKKEANGIINAEMWCRISRDVRIDEESTDRWRRYLNSAPEVSPYEEIKRKNRQLQELAAKIAESEQQYRDLTDSLPLIICTVDKDGNLLFGNKWLQHYSGLSIEQLNSNKGEDFFHPEDYSGVLENISRFSSGTFQRDREYRLREGRTGLYRWHMGSISPVCNDKGVTLYWSLFLADIHAQKEMEMMLKDNQELREMKLLLEEKIEALDITNKQLEQFAYVASHDLQEPLRKIMHFSDYLRSHYAVALPDEAQDILQRINSATGRMKTLITDVLSYSTIPNKNLEWQQVSMNIILKEALQELEVSIAEKDAHIVSSTLPAIEGVAVQLKQLIVNLLNNALKYSDSSRPVMIKVAGQVEQGSLILKIEDNGIGFENQYVPKMFAIFQRLHGRDKYTGTGIGLAICKKIVDLHNGTISAEGVPGLGATFTVRLPLSQTMVESSKEAVAEHSL